MALAAVLLGAGCTVPEHMEVRGGVDPRNQDDDVRFRTTYYFRVFDVCTAEEDGAGQNADVPATDSLYRFRMTGKANSLFSKVSFESGTLKSYEIDPFGATIVFDEKTGRHRYKSRHRTEQEAQREADQLELTRRIETYGNLHSTFGEDSAVTAKAKSLVEQQLDVIAGRSLPELGPGSAVVADLRLAEIERTVDALKKSRQMDGAVKDALQETLGPKLTEAVGDYRKAVTSGAQNASLQARKDHLDSAARKLAALKPGLDKVALGPINQSIKALEEAAGDLGSVGAGPEASGGPVPGTVCPGGTAARRGFQILGPEGWRTFDPDERLLMAMSSSGKPLISAMKELSDRVLQEQPNRAERLLPLMRASLTVARSQRRIDQLRARDDLSSDELLEALIAELEPDKGSEADLQGAVGAVPGQ